MSNLRPTESESSTSRIPSVRSGEIPAIVVKISRAHNDKPNLELLMSEAGGRDKVVTTYWSSAEGKDPEPCDFQWSRALLKDLSILQKDEDTTIDKEAAGARIGAKLRSFLMAVSARWAAEESKIDTLRRPDTESVVPHEKRVDVAFRLDAPELLALPWELVPIGHDRGTRLGQCDTCVVLYAVPGTATLLPEVPPASPPPIVFAWAGDKAHQVPYVEHEKAITAACREGAYLAPTVIENASLQSLKEALEGWVTSANGKREKGPPPSVLHLLCHGQALNETKPEGDHEQNIAFGILLKSGSSNESIVVTPAEFREAVAPYAETLRLVVLSACYSGAVSPASNALSTVALELHSAGIEAVIGSRFPLSEKGSIVLTNVLYRHLLVHFHSLQESLLAARRALVNDLPTFDWASVLLFARNDDGPDLRPIVRRPYRGLLTFEEAHAPFFCGRKAEIIEALTEIQKLFAKGPRIYLVTGASGRGKSSLLAAGLLPALRKALPEMVGLAGIDVTYKTIRPSMSFATLKSAVTPVPNGVLRILAVDQLEELFTSVPSNKRQIWFDEVWRFASGAAPNTLVVCSMRVDYLGHCGEIRVPEFGTLERVFSDVLHHVMLRPITSKLLREVIEEPAERVGLILQPGLVERIIVEAGDEPGTLPLVSYMMDELWKRRAGRTLTMSAYSELGGVLMVLQKQAAATLMELGQAQEGGEAGPPELSAKHIAQQILIRLVALPEGAAHGSRRIVKLSDLRRTFGKEAEPLFEKVLDVLARKWLIVVRDGTPGEQRVAANDERSIQAESFVEIAHEALIRQWKELNEWVRSREAVLEELRPYEKLASKRGGRLVGDGIELLKGIIAKHRGEIDKAVLELLAISEDDEQKRKQRDVARDRKILVIAVIAVVWAAITTALVVWIRNGQSKLVATSNSYLEQAAIARREALVSGARGLSAKREPVWAAKLLLSVDSPDDVDGWVEVANLVLQKKFPYRSFLGGNGSLAPDDEQIATFDNANQTLLLHRADGTFAPTRFGDVPAGITGMVWSAEGYRFLTTSKDGSVRLFRRDAPLFPAILEPHLPPEAQGERTAESPTISADGQILMAIVSGYAQGWDNEGRTVGQAFATSDAEVVSVSVSDDGRHALVRSAFGTVEVWTFDPQVACESPQTEGRPCRIATLSNHAISADFSSDDWGVYALSLTMKEGDKIDEDYFDSGLAGFIYPPTSIESWSIGKWATPTRSARLPKFDGLARNWITDCSTVDENIWLQFWYEYPKTLSVLYADNGGKIIKKLQGGAPVSTAKHATKIALTSETKVTVTDSSPFSPRVDLWKMARGLDRVELSRSGSWAITSSSLTNTSRLFRADAGLSGLVLSIAEDESAGTVLSAALSAHGEFALIEWDESGTFLWDILSRKPATLLLGGAALLSSDGERALTKFENRALIYNTHAPTSPLFSLGGADENLCDVRFATFVKGGNEVLLVCDDGTIAAASAKVGGPLRTVGKAADCPITGLPSFADTGALVLCGGDDVRIVSAEGQVFLPPVCGDSDIWAIAGDGGLVACAFESEVVVFEPDGSKSAVRHQLLPGKVRQIGFSPNGKKIWALLSDNSAAIMDAGLPAGSSYYSAPHPELPYAIEMDFSGNNLVTGAMDGAIRVFDTESRRLPISLPLDVTVSAAPGFAISADGQKVLMASHGGSAQVFHLNIASLKQELAANADCLPIELRRAYLGESDDVAEREYVLCEKGFRR